jgi:hypothetical protein
VFEKAGEAEYAVRGFTAAVAICFWEGVGEETERTENRWCSRCRMDERKPLELEDSDFSDEGGCRE